MSDGIKVLFTRALGLKAGWCVEKLELDTRLQRVDFTLRYEAQHLDCPVCGLADQEIHDRPPYSWRHLDFFQYEAWLHAPVPRVVCSGCKTTNLTAMPWAGEGSDPVPPAHERTQRLKGLRVLSVDDVPINQTVIRQLLKSEGALVSLAANGRLGVEAVFSAQQDQPFDLVLMDIQMPVMDGYEATRRIRSVPQLAQLPIIALTANVQPSDRAQCLAAGMNHHVGKPYDRDELVGVIRSVTGRKPGAHVTKPVMPQPPTEPVTAALPTAPPIHVYWLRTTALQPGPDPVALQQQAVVLRVLASIDALTSVLEAGAPSGFLVMDLATAISEPMRALGNGRHGASMKAMLIIVMADAATEEEMRAALRAGAIDMLPYPFALNYLNLICQRLLHEQRQWRADANQEIAAIDSQRAMERIQADTLFFGTLLRDFSNELPMRKKQLQDDWHRDPPAIKHHSHAVKGLAQTFGLHHLADVAGRTEADSVQTAALDATLLLQLEGEMASARFQILRWLNLHQIVAGS